MFKRDMFKNMNIKSALRNNVDYITFILSFISAVCFLSCGFLKAGVTSNGWTVISVLSIFSAVENYGSGDGAGIAMSVFLVMFIIVAFLLLIACVLFSILRALTEAEVFNDVLEVKLAAMTLSPAKIIALANVLITLVTMIMGCVCASSISGCYTPMFIPFIFAVLSLLSNFGIEFVCGKSNKFTDSKPRSSFAAREEYTENHGWNGTDDSYGSDGLDDNE